MLPNDENVSDTDTPKEAVASLSKEGWTSKRHEHFNVFRDYVKHEDGLIGNRLFWNLNIQGFLFTAYALSVQKMLEISQRVSESHAQICLAPGVGCRPLGTNDLEGHYTLALLTHWGIPIVGLSVALVSLAGVIAARLAIKRLERDWEANAATKTKDEPYLPSLTGGGSWWANQLGKLPTFTPLTFIAVWAAAIVFHPA